MIAQRIAEAVVAEFMLKRETSGDSSRIWGKDLATGDLVEVGQLVRKWTRDGFDRQQVMEIIWTYDGVIANFERGWHYYSEFIQGLYEGKPHEEMQPKHYVRRMSHLIICEMALNLLRSEHALIDPMVREALDSQEA